MTKAARKARPSRASRKPKGASLRAFAASVGVTHPAVIKAIRSGRLARSIAKDAKGRPRIVDAALAGVEWRAGSAKPGPSSGNGKHTLPGAPAPGAPPGTLPGTLTEAQLRVTFQREVKLELENMKSRGQLLDAVEERRRDFECARTVRDNILNVPDRLAAELAAESDPKRIHARLDEELRSALEVIAEALGGLDDVDQPGAAAGDHDAG